MSGLFFEMLAMDALDDLRKALSDKELKEFDSKYGSLVLRIRTEHSKRMSEINAKYEKVWQEEKISTSLKNAQESSSASENDQ